MPTSVKIPEDLPGVLKEFTKAAIRAQPEDVVQFASSYFGTLASEQPVPEKQKSEQIVNDNVKQETTQENLVLTPDVLKTLHLQIDKNYIITAAALEDKWKELKLPEETFDNIMTVGGFGEEIDWLKFLALACSSLGVDITKAMAYVCQTLTPEDEEVDAKIPFNVFKYLYSYLAEMDDDISPTHINSVLNHLQGDIDDPKKFIKVSDFVNKSMVKLG
ncbi:ropporin-1-like [Latimeria chalumnae]|uniref:ropporin-1-like n=1 Tax=Latimeria chalumnae TaxID=7897 RepID=UPI00313E80A9